MTNWTLMMMDGFIFAAIIFNTCGIWFCGTKLIKIEKHKRAEIELMKRALEKLENDISE
jgi:hypothetical protein